MITLSLSSFLQSYVGSLVVIKNSLFSSHQKHIAIIFHFLTVHSYVKFSSTTDGCMCDVVQIVCLTVVYDMCLSSATEPLQQRYAIAITSKLTMQESYAVIQSLSISIISNSICLLEVLSSFTFKKQFAPFFNPCSVSDGMSNSQSVSNHHSPIQLSLSNRS